MSALAASKGLCAQFRIIFAELQSMQPLPSELPAFGRRYAAPS